MALKFCLCVVPEPALRPVKVAKVAAETVTGLAAIHGICVA